LRVLVTAASRHEATAEIAARIAAGLAARGIDAEARAIEEVGEIGSYDAVVLGSAVYVGRWLREARRFAERHAATLQTKPVWLFSSGPVGAAGGGGESADAATLGQLTGAREHRVFGGRLERGRLGLAERLMVRAVDAREGDDRDWFAIDAFAGEIADTLGPSSSDNCDRGPRQAPSRLGGPLRDLHAST
jgi:menaquinone-dependent protoporphyrinogen oxidase